MTDLFPDTIDKGRPGATWWHGRYQVRNWNGWHQSREEGRGNWLFYVSTFSGPEDGNGLAHVARFRADGTMDYAPVPIDARNRILIDGRRYGRDHWNH